MKNTKKLLIFILSLFMIFTLSFATVYAEGEEEGGNTDPGQQDPVDPLLPQGSIVISGNHEVEVDKTITLDIAVTGVEDGYTVEWSSADESVATVDNNGTITGKKAGETTITAQISGTEIKDTYSITVKTKQEEKPAVKATLKKVTIKGADVNKIDDNTYEVKVTNNDIFKIADDGEHVIVVLSDKDAKYSMTSLDGRNEFKILVGDNVYTFKVLKEAANVNLASLKITGQSFNQTFDKDTTSYTLTVPYDINEIEITATAEDSNASITGTGYKDLPVGSTSFSITVTNGTEKKVYKIFVTREEDEEEPQTKKKTKKIVTNKNTSNQAEFDIPDVDDPDSTLNMTIITIGSIVLFLSGVLGIYFFFKTSPKRMKKELLKKKKTTTESPIVEIESVNNDNSNDDIDMI